MILLIIIIIFSYLSQPILHIWKHLVINTDNIFFFAVAIKLIAVLCFLFSSTRVWISATLLSPLPSHMTEQGGGRRRRRSKVCNGRCALNTNQSPGSSVRGRTFAASPPSVLLCVELHLAVVFRLRPGFSLRSKHAPGRWDWGRKEKWLKITFLISVKNKLNQITAPLAPLAWSGLPTINPPACQSESQWWGCGRAEGLLISLMSRSCLD